MMFNPPFVMPPELPMWIVLAMTVWVIWAFIREKQPIEMTCFFLLTALLLFGQFFPVTDAVGRNKLDAGALLAGFANPSLIAVMALLVMGQGILQTNALQSFSRVFVRAQGKLVYLAYFTILIGIAALSAFMNNTPLVILGIPVVQAMVAHSQNSLTDSSTMMPLSFVAILGGMTTLIGSSTNLLVSSAMEEVGLPPLAFFSFIIPGSILAVAGFIYVILFLPRFLPRRSRMLTDAIVSEDREFVAEIDVSEGNRLIGEECVGGKFSALPDVSIRMIQRRGHVILPPFEGYHIEAGDIIIIAATRDTLLDLLARYPGYLLSEEKTEILKSREGDDDGRADRLTEGTRARILAEVIITPSSRFIDMSVEQVAFGYQFGAVVLGIQRRARVVRRRFGRIRLEAGDVLLIAGPAAAINAMRGNKDVMVLSGSKMEVPRSHRARRAIGIFAAVVISAGMGVVSIPVAAVAGAVAMIWAGCLNIRQATRSLDRKIYLMVGAMLALGTALEVTGGIRLLAESLLDLPISNSPLLMMALFFMIVAVSTNVLSNNACAILFTPIGVNLALNLNVDPFLFAITVVFAANCSFATPIGYQTNLLVMAPGRYRFKDFVVAGSPLILVLWAVYIGLLFFYYKVPMFV
ncbi:MAG: SLC13 family permease [Pseudobdellovibrionaceae bacterium]